MTKTRTKQPKKMSEKTKSTLIVGTIGVLIGVIGTVLTYASFAAPGGKGGGSAGGAGTISLSLPPVTDQNGDGQPNFNDIVRFNVATTATTQPWVNLKCYVNSVLVAQSYEGYYPGTLDDGNFGLDSPQWTSGPADCVAYLDAYTTKGGKASYVPITSVSFHVNP